MRELNKLIQASSQEAIEMGLLSTFISCAVCYALYNPTANAIECVEHALEQVRYLRANPAPVVTLI